MADVVLRSLKDIEKLKFGDSYLIDVEGLHPPEEKETLKSFDGRFQKARKTVDEIQESVEKKFQEPVDSKIDENPKDKRVKTNNGKASK